jgi:hypothetical protein
MTSRESHHATAFQWQHQPAGFEAAAETLARRAKMHNGSAESGLRKEIEYWRKLLSTPQGEEFRTYESAHEQHFVEPLPTDDWRMPYGIDGPDARELMSEIEWRRSHGQSLRGLAWPASDDPYAPANDLSHPYHLPK